MRKMRLNVEELAVEAFAAEEGREPRRGTVRARSDTGPYCATAWGDYTCVGYGSCDPYAECLYTGLLPSCPAAGC